MNYQSSFRTLEKTTLFLLIPIGLMLMVFSLVPKQIIPYQAYVMVILAVAAFILLSMVLRKFKCPAAFQIDETELDKETLQFYRKRYLPYFGAFLGRRDLKDFESFDEKIYVEIMLSFIIDAIERIKKAKINWRLKVKVVDHNYQFIRTIVEMVFGNNKINTKEVISVIARSKSETIREIVPHGTTGGTGDSFYDLFEIDATTLAKKLAPKIEFDVQGMRLEAKYQYQAAALLKALQEWKPYVNLDGYLFSLFFVSDHTKTVARVIADSKEIPGYGPYLARIKKAFESEDFK